jgi:hypothetical protein
VKAPYEVRHGALTATGAVAVLALMAFASMDPFLFFPFVWAVGFLGELLVIGALVVVARGDVAAAPPPSWACSSWDRPAQPDRLPGTGRSGCLTAGEHRLFSAPAGPRVGHGCQPTWVR